MTNVDSTLNDYMHAWGARSVPFHDEEKQQLFETEHTRQAVERLQQSAALRSVMLLSGDNGVGKSALVASWVRSLEPKAYRPLTITQASLSASGVLCALLAKLGQVPGYQRAVNISRMEDAIGHPTHSEQGACRRGPPGIRALESAGARKASRPRARLAAFSATLSCDAVATTRG